MRSLPKRGSTGEDLITRPAFAATNFPVEELRCIDFPLEPLLVEALLVRTVLQDDLADADLIVLVVAFLDILLLLNPY